MATVEQLETGVRKAYESGNMEYARILGAELVRARDDKANLIPGAQVPGTSPQTPEPTVLDQVIGAGETALTLATGATGGTAGMVGGTVKGLAEQILTGEFGTSQANKAVEQAAMKGAQEFTYQPRTEAGQSQVKAIVEALSVIPPVIPMAGELSAVTGTAGRAAVPVSATIAGRIAAPIKEAAAAIKTKLTPHAELAQGSSIGALETPDAIRRAEVAAQMPVPFVGNKGLTSGQASRNFSQLQFEKESAKLAELGQPLRDRVENQAATMIANFDALVDRAQPFSVEARDIGRSVDKALVNKMGVAKAKIRTAYEKAREGGALAEPITLAPVSTTLTDLERFEGLSPMIASVRKEAQRIGAVVRDDGTPGSPMQPGTIPLEGTEMLRQFVNEATDWTDRREALYARRINSAIDEATEGKGGELYKQARSLRSQYANEFENVGLTSKLVGTKRGTDERTIALEDVFDKVVIASPLEELNKVRKSLLTAEVTKINKNASIDGGKQAWQDLKAAGLNYIKNASLSASQMDSAGTPLLSPDKLNRVITSLDRQGKLDSLYGKRQAQTLRDLAELSKVIYTSPPGAVNASNTASALRNAIAEMAATGIITGVPAPVITALRQANQYVKDRKTRIRIEAALKQN
jgi:hypothetical protein